MNLDKAKAARLELRRQIADAFKPFDCYGLGIHIPGSIHTITEACEAYHKARAGEDV